MMRNSILLFVAIASVTGLTAGISSAQAPISSYNMGLYEGEYRDLTWLRRLKLESAPFVNPGLLDNATIAYKFNFFDISAMEENGQEVIERLQEGDIDYCMLELGSCEVMEYDENQRDNEESLQYQLIEALSADQVHMPDGMFLVDRSNAWEDFSSFGAIVSSLEEEWKEENHKYLYIPTVVDRLRAGDIGYCMSESGSCDVVGYDENQRDNEESLQYQLIEALSADKMYVPKGMFLVGKSEGWKGFSNVGSIVSWEKGAEIRNAFDSK